MIPNNSCLKAYNDTLMVEHCLFGCILCVCCFVIHLSLYLGGCIICACYRSVGGQYITVSS